MMPQFCFFCYFIKGVVGNMKSEANITTFISVHK